MDELHEQNIGVVLFNLRAACWTMDPAAFHAIKSDPPGCTHEGAGLFPSYQSRM